MRWLRALLHLVLAVALVGAVPMPVALSAPAACDHHSAASHNATSEHSGDHGDRNAHAGHHRGVNAPADHSGHHTGMSDHVGMQTAAAHAQSAPANAPVHQWNCCQAGCCVAPSQLTVAPDTHAVAFAHTVRYWTLAERALGRTETPDPGIPKAAG
jgi:hypothetical protein